MIIKQWPQSICECKYITVNCTIVVWMKIGELSRQNVIGETNKLYAKIIYKWFNTSLYTTFFVTSTGTPLLLRISTFKSEGNETRYSAT